MSHQVHLPLQFFCKQIIDTFQQAIANPDPAAFLYRKGVRTPLFMAESLTRVLLEINHTAKNEKALKLFKKLEDALGEIEDYDDMVKQFEKNKAIKKDEVNYFEKKRDKAIEKLNGKLIKKEFYQAEFKKIINGIIANFNDKDIVHKLQDHIKRELDLSFKCYCEFKNGFTDMETQVHEIRRNLRWVSIYGKSFNGTIVLEKKKTNYAWEKKFISANATTDPYNTLPLHKNLNHFIVFDQKAFYALNSVIDSLGNIKDKGLAIEFLAKSIRKTNGLKKEESKALALKHLKVKYTETGLLNEVHVLLKAFFDTYGIHKLII